MRVPTLDAPRVNPRTAPSEYSRAGSAVPNISGLQEGLNLAARVAYAAEQTNEQNANKLKADRDRLNGFKTLSAYQQFEGNVKKRQQELRTQVKYDQADVSDFLMEDFENEAARFGSQLDDENIIEMGPRIEELRSTMKLNADDFEFKHHTLYYSTDLDKTHEATKTILGADPSPENLVIYKSRMFEAIERSGLSDVDKQAKRDIVARDLETLVYKERVKRNGTLGPGTGKVEAGSVADVVLQGAKSMGGDDQLAADLLTLISYETAGTFSTGIIGGKDNLYQGIIQFGPEERAKYGVTGNETFAEQFEKAKQFFIDRGYKPGMGLLDLYSIVNAGSPGRYEASDRPGSTVRTHVQAMLDGPHRAKALAILGGKIDVGALDKSPLFQNVSYDDRVAASNDAIRMAMAENQARHKQASDAYMNDFNSLLVSLNDGKAGLTDLETFRETNPGMSYDDINKAQTVIENHNKAGQVLADAITFMRSGAIFDPTDSDHKKYADALVGKEGLAALNAADEGYVAGTLMPMVERSGMVPPSVAGTLQGMMRSQNPQQVTYALDSLSQIRDAFPKAFDALPDQLNRDLDLWGTAKNYMNQKELVDLIRGAPSAEQRQAQTMLREDARRKLTVSNDPDYVSFDRVIDSFDEWFASPDVRGTADAKVMMRSEFNGLFEYEYTRDGNAEQAADRAIKQMKRIWGVTGVGGAKHIMKYAPETQYRPVMGSHDWIAQQVREELKLAPDETFVPVADGQTHTEVQRNRFAAGGQGDRANRPETQVMPPSYQIIKIKDGLPTAVMKDGKPYRIFFQIPEKLKAQELAVFNYEQQKQVDNLFLREVTGTPTRGGYPPMMPEIQQEINARKKRLEILKEKVDSFTSPEPYANDVPASPDMMVP